MDEALGLWLGLGKDWAEFWKSTPHIAERIVMARQKRDHRETIMQAWYNEYMARQKRLRGLSHYLKESKPIKPLKKGEAVQAGPWLALMGIADK